MTRIKTSVNRQGTLRLASETSNRLAYNAARSVQARLRRTAPRKTGALSESFQIDRVKYGTVTSYSVWTPLEYANYQNKGTGPIFPRPGGVLRFEAGGQIVFAKSTRGVPATHFMDRAYAAITADDFTSA